MGKEEIIYNRIEIKSVKSFYVKVIRAGMVNEESMFVIKLGIDQGQEADMEFWLSNSAPDHRFHEMATNNLYRFGITWSLVLKLIEDKDKDYIQEFFKEQCKKPNGYVKVIRKHFRTKHGKDRFTDNCFFVGQDFGTTEAPSDASLSPLKRAVALEQRSQNGNKEKFKESIRKEDQGKLSSENKGSEGEESGVEAEKKLIKQEGPPPF